MKPFRLDYDPDYGIDHRSGWTVHYDGCVLVQFARGPLRALWRAWWKWREMEQDQAMYEHVCRVADALPTPHVIDNEVA